MKRIHVPGVVDVVTSDDLTEIESLAANPKLDRVYADRSIPANAAFLDQLLGVLQVNGKRFPTVSPMGDSARAAAQDALWKRLSAIAPTLSAGSDSLEPLAAIVRGDVPADGAGLLVQQIIGTLFAPDFKATQESWDAALVLAEAPHNLNPLQATATDDSGNHQFDTGTLVQLKLQDANAKTPDADLAFLRNTWSRCPAEQWVPALFAGIWRRACQVK